MKVAGGYWEGRRNFRSHSLPAMRSHQILRMGMSLSNSCTVRFLSVHKLNLRLFLLLFRGTILRVLVLFHCCGFHL